MTPEKLVQEMKAACGDKLKSVILYGSAAAGDYGAKNSDYNLLVVVEDMEQATLKAFSRSAITWAKAGNPAPLLFTEARLKQAGDVFPIELLDIKDCHKILFGINIVEDIDISTVNLRLQIEHELRGKLIQLRQGYLMVAGKQNKVVELMTQSLSTFLVLFRAALRLFEDDVPAKKIDALTKLTGHIEFDMDVFKNVQQIKSGDVKIKYVKAESLFGRYLNTIENVIDAVDAFIKKGEER